MTDRLISMHIYDCEGQCQSAEEEWDYTSMQRAQDRFDYILSISRSVPSLLG